MKPTTPFLRTPHNYDTNAASLETALKCQDPTLAQQQFAEESDINFIAKRYGLTGELPQVLDLPRYGDFSGIFDFQSAQNAVRQALEQFGTLPAHLRKRFDNEPQKLLEFLEDPSNAKEAEFLGLTKPREDEAQSPTAAPKPTGGGEIPTQPPKGNGAAATPPETPSEN